jgi:predicted metal-dependent hydrolase
VKSSTSDLLIANCDEFIYYDDLVRKKQPRKKAARKPPRKGAKATVANGKDEKEAEDRSQEALDLIMETLEALAEERGSEEKIWGSMVKQTLKRRSPGFNETYYGFRSFNRLLEEAAARGLMELESDEKSGGYIIRRFHQEE